MDMLKTIAAGLHYSESRSGLLLAAALLACGTASKYDWACYGALYGAIVAGYLFVNSRVRAGGRAPRVDLTGKIALVTGANTGIGKETAIALAEQGATVVIACRDQNKAAKALNQIKERSRSENVESMSLDLASFSSIKAAANTFLAKYDRLDILINNSGVAFCPYQQTKDGLELQIGTNHYGPFLLTNLLIPALKKAPAARIVNVSSMAHLFASSVRSTSWSADKYDTTAGYAESKLANIYFTTHLHRLLTEQGSTITVYACHPGGVATEIQRHNPTIGKLLPYASYLFLKTPIEGAQTSLYCALSPAAVPGGYHIDCHHEPLLACAADPEKAKQLWEQSQRITQCKTNI